MARRCQGFTDLSSLQQQFDGRSKQTCVIVEVSILGHGARFIKAYSHTTHFYQLARLSDDTQFETHCPMTKCGKQFSSLLHVYQHYAKPSESGKGKVERVGLVKCLYQWNSEEKRFVAKPITHTGLVKQSPSEVCDGCSSLGIAQTQVHDRQQCLIAEIGLTGFSVLYIELYKECLPGGNEAKMFFCRCLCSNCDKSFTDFKSMYTHYVGSKQVGMPHAGKDNCVTCLYVWKSESKAFEWCQTPWSKADQSRGKTQPKKIPSTTNASTISKHGSPSPSTSVSTSPGTSNKNIAGSGLAQTLKDHVSDVCTGSRSLSVAQTQIHNKEKCLIAEIRIIGSDVRYIEVDKDYLPGGNNASKFLCCCLFPECSQVFTSFQSVYAHYAGAEQVAILHPQKNSHIIRVCVWNSKTGSFDWQPSPWIKAKHKLSGAKLTGKNKSKEHTVDTTNASSWTTINPDQIILNVEGANNLLTITGTPDETRTPVSSDKAEKSLITTSSPCAPSTTFSPYKVGRSGNTNPTASTPMSSAVAGQGLMTTKIVGARGTPSSSTMEEKDVKTTPGTHQGTPVSGM